MSWRVCFLINLPVGAIAFNLSLVYLIGVEGVVAALIQLLPRARA